jgi:hypothetical protein
MAVDEFVKSLRLGVVQIFGIIVPGLVVLASLVFLAHVAGACGSCGFTVAWSSHRVEVAAGVLTAAYILGFIVRLVPMELVDRFSRRWLERRLGPEMESLKGQYPYENLRAVLAQDGMPELAAYVSWHEKNMNPVRARINSLKLIVANESEVLGAAMATAEANIRMMFGTFVAGLVALLVLVCSFVAPTRWTCYPVARLVLVALILCSLLLIVMTFTQTRYNELVRLLTAVKICVAKNDVVTRVVEQVVGKQGAGSIPPHRGAPE